MIGTIVGKYRVVDQVGRGATGIVYKAVDETLDREVAIKVLNPALADSDIIKRFRAEATTLAKLSHPDIATIYELLKTDTDLLMVMELVRGETLEQLSARVGPMPPDRAGYIVDRILSALEHAHRAGIVHRDMKPANVMVTELGGVKIMDFGIARVRGTEHMTVEGQAIGTPAYMPPEQALGEDVDGRADLYSVGVIFYRLLTGTLPFDADTPIGMLQKQIADTPAPLRFHRQGLAEWCETVVQRALAKSPAARFQTAEEFRDALKRASRPAMSIDRATSVGTPASQVATASPTAAPVHTVALSRTEAGLSVSPDGDSGVLERVANWLHLSGSQFTQLGTQWPETAEAVWQGAIRFSRTRNGALFMAAVVMTICATYAALGGRAVDTASEGPSTIRTSRTPAATEAPSLEFETRALVGSGTRQRESVARLLLAHRILRVTPYSSPDEPLYSVPYDSVVAIHYSRGRDPMWKSAKGPARVTRFGGGTLGRLGIFVERQWVSVQTNTDDRFVILRFDDDVVRRALRALEERTGRSPIVVSGG
jgi:serine/threonine-protein kinase